MVGINRLKDSMKSTHPQAKNPLILRYHRLMDAFAKSDDERDFYLDKVEGFLLYVDLDKGIEELETLDKEVKAHSDSYCPIPKMTFYEVKNLWRGSSMRRSTISTPRKNSSISSLLKNLGKISSNSSTTI